MKLTVEAVERYLKGQLGESAQVIAVRDMKGSELLRPDDLKAFGYGSPLQVDVLLEGELRSFVLSTMQPSERFGHDHFADRAQVMIWGHDAFNRLPRHVPSLDVGYLTRGGELKSAGEAVEYFLLLPKVEGEPYRLDLDRLLRGGDLRDLDLARAEALSNYLAEIHGKKFPNATLYRRRLRDIIGHGEGIMGILDGYPEPLPISQEVLRRIEERCVTWRWRLRDFGHRLSIVHGDFHPWNILFRRGTDFTLLDRSRGEWGEPADDVSALTINYLFFSLQRYGKLEGPFATIFETFYENYLLKTQDLELAKVVPLFYAFRGLVIASPLWYPSLAERVRLALFHFVENMLGVEEFEHQEINRYLD
jgi:hypothetical protein